MLLFFIIFSNFPKVLINLFVLLYVNLQEKDDFMRKKTVFFIVIWAVTLLFAMPIFSEQLTLDEAINVALENNANINMAKNDLISAKSRTQGAKSTYYPQLSVKNDTFEIASEDDKTMDKGTSISATWKLFDMGMRELGINSNLSSERMQSYSLKRTTQSVIYDVSSNFFQVLRNRELFSLATSNVDYYQNLKKQTEARISVGDLAKVDLLTIDSSLANANVSLLSARNRYRTSLLNLQYSMGLFPTDDFDIVSISPEDNREILPISDYIKTAVASRPDLKGSEHAIKSATSNKKLAERELFPIVSINGEYHNYIDYETRHGSDARIMGYITLNLFDGFATQAKIDQSNMTLKNQKENKLDLEKNINTSIGTLYADIINAKERMVASNAGVIATENNRVVQDEKYSEGLATTLDVLNAQMQYDTALSNLIEAKYDYKIFLINMDFATGVLGENNNE